MVEPVFHSENPGTDIERDRRFFADTLGLGLPVIERNGGTIDGAYLPLGAQVHALVRTNRIDGPDESPRASRRDEGVGLAAYLPDPEGHVLGPRSTTRR
jgi:hypothetical protein